VRLEKLGLVVSDLPRMADLPVDFPGPAPNAQRQKSPAHGGAVEDVLVTDAAGPIDEVAAPQRRSEIEELLCLSKAMSPFCMPEVMRRCGCDSTHKGVREAGRIASWIS
jgi:hypothetical protein